MGYWWAFILLGLVCGLYSGTFGVGAATLLIPALVLIPIFALPQKSAQGVCLGVMVPMVLVGAIRYWLKPEIEVDLRIVGLIAAGAVVGAYLGASIAGAVPGVLLRRLFAVLLICLAILMLLKPATKAKAAVAEAPAPAENTAAEP